MEKIKELLGIKQITLSELEIEYSERITVILNETEYDSDLKPYSQATITIALDFLMRLMNAINSLDITLPYPELFGGNDTSIHLEWDSSIYELIIGISNEKGGCVGNLKSESNELKLDWDLPIIPSELINWITIAELCPHCFHYQSKLQLNKLLETGAKKTDSNINLFFACSDCITQDHPIFFNNFESPAEVQNEIEMNKEEKEEKEIEKQLEANGGYKDVESDLA